MTLSIPEISINGAIDLHIHSAPDSMQRSMDGLEVASLASNLGMRAIVLKNHFQHTASLAYIVGKLNPGIKVFGGIALNLAVGGINPFAVEQMIRVTGDRGRFVWMPTFDSEHHVSLTGGGRPFVAVARNGVLLPEVIEVMKIVAKSDLILATGHSSPAEALLLVQEARRLSIKTIIATHPIADPIYMDTAGIEEIAALGAYIEFTCLEISGPKMASSASIHAKAIRAIGVERCFLASDLGQTINPPPPEGFKAFINDLVKEGFNSKELDIITKRNPAKILGLGSESVSEK
jgi:hypothetical protein